MPVEDEKMPPPGELKRIKGKQDRNDVIDKQELTGRHKWYTDMMVDLEFNTTFSASVTVVIVLAGLVAGIQTYPGTDDGSIGDVFVFVDKMILWIFFAEVVVKVSAQGKAPLNYLRDPWNRFDFIIVVLGFISELYSLPIEPSLLRTVRLLRVLKLLNALPSLQILVGSLIKSTNSMVYILLLLSLLFYLYGVMGCVLFAKNDPFHFGTLEMSLLSLYRISTFEDWTDIMYINMYGCDKYGYPIGQWGQLGTRVDGRPLPESMRCTNPEKYGVVASLFFCSFVLLCTLIVFNLFIGVIITNIDKAKDEMLSELALVFENYKKTPEYQATLSEEEKEEIEDRENALEDLKKLVADATKDTPEHKKYQRELALMTGAPADLDDLPDVLDDLHATLSGFITTDM